MSKHHGLFIHTLLWRERQVLRYPWIFLLLFV